MSGGSLDYLHHQSIGYDHNPNTHNLLRAVEQLEAKCPGALATRNARALYDSIWALNGLHESLAEVFNLIDRAGSGDSAWDDVDEAVAAYEKVPR